MAADLDLAPGNLSVQLSDDPARHFSVDSLERYIERTGDLSPILYLAERFMADAQAKRDQAVNQIAAMAPMFAQLLAQAGVPTGRGRK